MIFPRSSVDVQILCSEHDTQLDVHLFSHVSTHARTNIHARACTTSFGILVFEMNMFNYCLISSCVFSHLIALFLSTFSFHTFDLPFLITFIFQASPSFCVSGIAVPACHSVGRAS